MSESQPFTRKLIEALYVEALVLADEARSAFHLEEDRAEFGGTSSQRVDVSCEALRATTRILQSIAWLLHQKAYLAGELSEADLGHRNRQLGDASPSDPRVAAFLTEDKRHVVAASEDLYERVARLQATLHSRRAAMIGASQVHSMQDEIARRFRSEQHA